MKSELLAWLAKHRADRVAEHEARLAEHPHIVNCAGLSRATMNDEFLDDLYARRAWCYETLASSHMVKESWDRPRRRAYIRFLFADENEAILFKLRFC